jgi:hypothetical protein
MKNPPDIRGRIPDWVPAPIARYYRESHEKYWPRYDAEPVIRVLEHERMREVGRQLLRKEKGAYVYQAKPQEWDAEWQAEFDPELHSLAGDDADSRQYRAMMELIDEVIECSGDNTGMKLPILFEPPTSFTVREVKQRYREVCDTADTLRHYSSKGRAYHWLYVTDEKILRDAEMVLRKRGAARYEHEMIFATTRKTKHGQKRAVVIKLGNTMQRLFGQKMSGTVARLVTVATGRTITIDSVKKWLQSGEGTPRVKKAPKKTQSLPD